jgi:hypothetical protein
MKMLTVQAAIHFGVGKKYLCRTAIGEMKRAIAPEEQERTKAMAEQKRMTDRFASTLDCCVDHCGCTAGKGAGHQQTFASFDISRFRQHWTGEDDS